MIYSGKQYFEKMSLNLSTTYKYWSTYRYLSAYKFSFKQWHVSFFRREAPLWTCESFTHPVRHLFSLQNLLMQLCTEYSRPFLYCRLSYIFLSLFRGPAKEIRMLCTRMQKTSWNLSYMAKKCFAQSNMDKNIFHQHNIPPKLKRLKVCSSHFDNKDFSTSLRPDILQTKVHPKLGRLTSLLCLTYSNALWLIDCKINPWQTWSAVKVFDLAIHISSISLIDKSVCLVKDSQVHRGASLLKINTYHCLRLNL